ncbi:MAG: Rrf2 family transcriptional regulator [Eubacteriales bacterium]
MKLSTKGRYALEALVVLGDKIDEYDNISLKAICTETGLSNRYLDQLFRELKNDEIVSSKKGKNGGYQLAKASDDITVKDILTSVEGSLAPVKCIDNKPCSRGNKCIAIDLWTNIHDEIEDVISNITLKSLIDDYRANKEENEKNENIN